jgi:Icc-related predicted phosphoesterase
MKIAYASDLHVEFESLEIYNTVKADVLVLAGDIILASRLYDKNERHFLGDREFLCGSSDRFHAFFQQVCEEFPNVIYILGNHESYHFDIANTYSHIKEKLSYLKNLHVLEKETFQLEDVTIVCGTMWTDFNKGNECAMRIIERRMNDFQIVKNSNKTNLNDDWSLTCWSATDAYEDHQKFLEFAKNELDNEDNRKVVMVTHHCPSDICIPEKYKGDTMMNPGYVSNLTDFILDNPKIRAWICGHSHRTLDAMIGSTNILMNCRGYAGMEEMSYYFELKYVDI